MKCRTVVKDYLSVFLICAGSFCTLLSWLLITRFVRNEFALMEAAILDVNAEFDEQTSEAWKILRGFNFDNELLRQRREVHMQQLSRAMTVGIFNHKLNPPSEDNYASIDVREEKAYIGDRVGTIEEPRYVEEEYTGDYQPIHQYTSSVSSATNAHSIPGSMIGPPSVTPYQIAPEYVVEAGDVVPECRCSQSTNCPAGPPGPKGIAGIDGSDGEPGTAGLDGMDYDDIMEPTPFFNACVSCPEGERGPPGSIGIRGRRGPRGASGTPGIPGRNGNPGSPGAMGVEGLPGVDGELGVIGSPGMDGIKGEGRKGPQGIRGREGPMGPQGDHGDHGLDGEVGPEGVVGEQGEVGPTGDDGVEGPVGQDGEPGYDADYCPCPRRIYHFSNLMKRLV